MATGPHFALRDLRIAFGWLLFALFLAMVAVWTIFGVMPGLIGEAPEPFAAFGRISEFWPIFVGFLAGGGAAWALAPGLSIHGDEEGEKRINLSPLAAALLGPAALIMMFAAYWPCAGDENPIWASLRYALEALEGYVAEPFGVVHGCPAEFPQGLLAGILFGRTTLVLVIGLGFAYIFRHSIDAVRARFAAQVVLFAGLDGESADAARSVRKNLTGRQRLLLLDAGPELARARELAQEIGAIVLSLDVTDAKEVETFMRARGRRGIQGLHLMSSDSGTNVRAMEFFIRWQGRLASAPARVLTGTSGDLERVIAERVTVQRRILKHHQTGGVWRSPKGDSGLVPRAQPSRTEVPGRIVVRIDNPWHAEDWRQRQMVAHSGWLFDAVSTNEIAARHVVWRAKREGIRELVLIGSSPFELAVLSEIAFEHRVDHVLAEASKKDNAPTGASARIYEPSTPAVLLHGHKSAEAADHFQRQLLRFGITDAKRYIHTGNASIEKLMDDPLANRAMLRSDPPGNDSTFLAARHPRWRIFDWAEKMHGLTAEPMLGGLSIVGPTLEPVLQTGVDIWERLARIKHQIYLYDWRGGIPVPGDPNRGDWDDDLDEFAKESNIRSFATFCRSIADLGRQWATDLGEGGAQSEHPLEPAELLLVAKIEHDSWVRHHVEYGWRFGDHDRGGDTSGRAKAKLHPDIVEWEALSGDDQRKDVDSIASTIALMKSLGFSLVDARPAES